MRGWKCAKKRRTAPGVSQGCAHLHIPRLQQRLPLLPTGGGAVGEYQAHAR